MIDCTGPVEWHGCYAGQYDLWAPESYVHPAKGSPALFFRILEHLEALGLLHPGQTVLDPMCGTGTTLLAAAAKGHPAVGVELEPRFVSLAQANADRIASKGFCAPIRVIQGDARNLSTLLQERGVVAVSSPPYGGPSGAGGLNTRPPRRATDQTGRDACAPSQQANNTYGITPGQIGSLPDRPVVVTSPPYGDQKLKVASDYHVPITGSRHSKGTDSVIANLGYESEGQIANLPDRPCAITSPPYEDSDNRGKMDKVAAGWGRDNVRRGGPILRDDYGHSDGQLGQERGDTYLSAMRQVYAEIATVAGVLVVVVKNPTRNGKLRDLTGDTIAVLEATGWQVHCHHHATLFEEQEQGDMFAGSQKQVKGRMSFFKRLSWAKGSPVADHEDILVAEVVR